MDELIPRFGGVSFCWGHVGFDAQDQTDTARSAWGHRNASAALCARAWCASCTARADIEATGRRLAPTARLGFGDVGSGGASHTTPPRLLVYRLLATG